jgi:hypothetical protein
LKSLYGPSVMPNEKNCSLRFPFTSRKIIAVLKNWSQKVNFVMYIS